MAENAVALTSTAYVTLDGFSIQFARLTGVDAQNVEVRGIALAVPFCSGRECLSLP